jgi:RNA polymerase sigma-70 factor (ECF subfamily)
MSPDPNRDGWATNAGAFDTTHWTVVLAARDKDGTVAREALASLCSSYWYPLYAFVRRQGSSPHEAEDLTQEFFYRFLERHSLENVQPAAGKFRSYLLVCLKHFMANERRRKQAQRRGAGVQVVPLDSGVADTWYLAEPSHAITPEVLFERRWAFAVLNLAMEELRREYVQRGKAELFEQFRGFLPGDAPSAPRAELAARHGLSPGAVDVAVHRFRQRFGVLLREQVARTVSSAAEVEEELRHLISVLST